MTPLEKFKQISKIDGVDQYILVNPKGNIASHDIKNPEKAANIVLLCGQNSFAIGKAHFKYLVFSRENHKNFFIFPVGKYYLGVVKKNDVNNFILADNIMNFLKTFLK